MEWRSLFGKEEERSFLGGAIFGNEERRSLLGDVGMAIVFWG
ncbi:MAG: hypothetical protein ACKO2V_22215 [Snowella sp.]